MEQQDQGSVDLHRADAYGRSFADVYDHWYDGVSDAEATARFMARRCSGHPLLELGVGSGRLAIPLARLGLSVIGLDGSAPMLNLCPPADSLSLVRADMRALPFTGPISGVLIAFNTLFNLSSEGEQLALLRHLQKLLADDGVIVIEALDVSALVTGPARSIGVRDVDRQRLIVTATQLDQERQLLTGQHVEITDNAVSIRPWRLRWSTPAQLDDLAGQAGLRLDERFGSWDEEPFTDTSETHISVYRRAASSSMPV